MKRYFLIFIVISLFLISTVSANENITSNQGDGVDTYLQDNLPIQYTELEYVTSYYDYLDWAEVYGPLSVDEFNLTDKQDVWADSNKSGNDKVNPNFKLYAINRTIDGNGTFVIEGNSSASGLIYLSFLKELINLTNGKFSYDFHNLRKGAYIFDLFYTGDGTFSNCTYNKIWFELPAFSTNIVQNDSLIMYYKNGSNFTAKLCDDVNRPMAGKSMDLYINGCKYSRTTDDKGEFSLNINLNPGKYVIKTMFRGHMDIVAGCQAFCNLIVLPTFRENNGLVKYYQNSTQFEVVALDTQGNIATNRLIQFNVNGIFYNRTTDLNGVARLNINLPTGKYIITSINNDTCKISSNITVLPTIETSDLVKVFRNGSQFIVKLLNKDGSPLTNANLEMNVNGIFYKRTTDVTGKATLNINLPVGKYIITTENIKDGCKISNNIEVLCYLYTFDMVKYYKNDSRYSVKLLDENHNPVSGEKIIIEVNGVSYTTKTNNNGIASLAINLLPGQYQVTAKSVSDPSLISITTVKVIPTLYFVNKTYCQFDSMLFPVVVLDGHGNPAINKTVHFDIDGRKVDAKSDVNGIANPNIYWVCVQETYVEATYDDYSISMAVYVDP